MNADVDIAVIGAGPAGMSAAIAAAQYGLSCIVFDEQDQPGGQIYRGITQHAGGSMSEPLRERILGPDYLSGRSLAEAFLSCGTDYRPHSTVWSVNDSCVSWSSPAGGGDTQAKFIVAATGAMERPFPVKGWALPGVMTAGAAQILLKTAGMVEDDAVFVGSGPLIYLIAAQYIRAGARIRAILDTTPRRNRLSALSNVSFAGNSIAYIKKGLGLLGEISRSKCEIIRGVEEIEIVGSSFVTGVRWKTRKRNGTIDCARVFVHHGVIPNVNLTMSAQCSHEWIDRQCNWRPVSDVWGATSQPWMRVAGDGRNIDGARSAAITGEIVVAAIAAELGVINIEERDRAGLSLRRELERDTSIRPFLETMYRPSDRFRIPDDPSTLVCRCEEVTVAQVCQAVNEGCMGPNQFKGFTRAGMGPCQGRMCGTTISELFAQKLDHSVQETGYYRIRTPIKPVTIADIAGVD
ncbi:Hydrogen cyanide synthase subunit HcnB [Paraburkholderia aspalathi]|uniref:Hydrogen cyanide synthase subunit HcnB n=1 Tax=Paraburkholderia aspalathi TaxID=1324617 RepID=A0ABM8T0L1_9BURK|nr:NAD(P)/FAD-dependent oxidoreductase [Paraburkholderia aspalathi]MBK3823245.1 FAD-dependent oxidoreductase [Paraburkholderia aspalathi]MBK3835077.1 FAD-dependent oxidoreductase [Paraburkholderia aspalathi]MBK3864831.1 FAD-dependent oxidoreductase [Paraburkholderia aspalathi]CAE6845046.1 Hydrogen cyanide synthase subunit HcnB [Paraburkholderia aspalathi]